MLSQIDHHFHPFRYREGTFHSFLVEVETVDSFYFELVITHDKKNSTIAFTKWKSHILRAQKNRYSKTSATPPYHAAC